MFKWIKIIRWIKKMRKKHGKYAFKVVTNDNTMVFYVEGTDDKLRVSY